MVQNEQGKKNPLAPPPRVDCVWFYLPTYTVDDT